MIAGLDRQGVVLADRFVNKLKEIGQRSLKLADPTLRLEARGTKKMIDRIDSGGTDRQVGRNVVITK